MLLWWCFSKRIIRSVRVPTRFSPAGKMVNYEKVLKPKVPKVKSENL